MPKQVNKAEICPKCEMPEVKNTQCPGEFTPYRFCIIGYNITGIDGEIELVGAGSVPPENRFTYCPYCKSKIAWPEGLPQLILMEVPNRD